MTDITTTAPISIRHQSLQFPKFPKLEIGRKVEAISKAVMQAFEMAYLAPFSTPQRKPPVAVDDADLEGRDPNW
jgi:hypothetical protein